MKPKRRKMSLMDFVRLWRADFLRKHARKRFRQRTKIEFKDEFVEEARKQIEEGTAKVVEPKRVHKIGGILCYRGKYIVILEGEDCEIVWDYLSSEIATLTRIVMQELAKEDIESEKDNSVHPDKVTPAG